LTGEAIHHVSMFFRPFAQDYLGAYFNAEMRGVYPMRARPPGLDGASACVFPAAVWPVANFMDLDK